MLVPFALYKNEKLLFVSKHWEDLEEFVEELKKLNKKTIDRREFTIRTSEKEIFKSWSRK